MPASSMRGSAAFTPVGNRNDLIDSLRAFALCGVILFNILAMVGGFLGKQLLAAAKPSDFLCAAIVVLLIQGKARACFALLFGVGFGILMNRASAKGQDFTAFYLKRMLVLLGLGLFNLSFLFFGDILILYALLGMVMLLFRNSSDRTLLTTGMGLILIPPLIEGALEVLAGGALPNLRGLTSDQVAALMPGSIQAYEGSSYAAYVVANWTYYFNLYAAETADTLVYALSVLGLFLIGFWVARNEVLSDITRWRPLLRKLAWWCLPMGLALSLVQGSRRLGIPAEGILHGIVTASYAGLSIAAFGYIALACLLLSGALRWLRPVMSPMGRMGLTGYLGSNAIGGFVFYGWGLGSMTRWSITGIFLFGLLLFLGLCLFSAVWLRAFRFGPAEWLWRSLTYGRAQPMLRNPDQLATSSA